MAENTSLLAAHDQVINLLLFQIHIGEYQKESLGHFSQIELLAGIGPIRKLELVL